jgi:hypothetical protein
MVLGIAMWSYGFNIGQILNDWAASGVFAYVLPFLLVFAVVYGILSKTHIIADDSNKGVNVVIALAIGALSLVGDFVPTFFQTIFPYLGMGLSVLLALIILGGLFIFDTEFKKKTQWVIWIVGLLIFVVVVYNALGDYNFGGAYFWNMYGSSLIVLAIIIGLIAWVTSSRSRT